MDDGGEYNGEQEESKEQKESRKQEENFAGLDFHEIPEFVKDISSVRGRTSEMLLFSIFLMT